MSSRFLPDRLAGAAGNGAHVVVPFVFPSVVSGHDTSDLHDILTSDLNTTGGKSGKQERFLELDMGDDNFPAYLDPGVLGFARAAHLSQERERNVETGILTVLRRVFIERGKILPQRKPVSRVILQNGGVAFSEVDTSHQAEIGKAEPAVHFSGHIHIGGALQGVYGIHFPSGELGWAKLFDLQTSS